MEKKFKIAVCDVNQKGKVISVVCWNCNDEKEAKERAAGMTNDALSFVFLGAAY